MIRSIRLALLALACAACAGPSLRYSGAIATSEDPRAHDVASKRVLLNDRVVVVTRVEAVGGAPTGGAHAVRWNWYEGSTLIAERAKTIDFVRLPFRFVHSLAASDLGVGRYRVEILVDGVKIDEQSFSVVAS